MIFHCFQIQNNNTTLQFLSKKFTWVDLYSTRGSLSFFIIVLVLLCPCHSNYRERILFFCFIYFCCNSSLYLCNLYIFLPKTNGFPSICLRILEFIIYNQENNQQSKVCFIIYIFSVKSVCAFNTIVNPKYKT